MKKVVISLLSISTVLFFISCGSKPAPEEAEPEAPVVEQQEEEPVVEEEPEAEEIDEEAELAALLEKIENARAAALEAGAEESAPDMLKKVDDYLEQCKANGSLKENADDIIARYELIANLVKAQEAKKEIDDNGFAQYDQKDYDEAEAALAKVMESLDSEGALDASVTDSAKAAYSGYNTVLVITYKKLAKEERELAYAAKKDADSVKAGVSQKERYQAAADSFKNADSLYAMQNAKKAREQYIAAKDEFSALYKEVSERRAAAQAAIDAAKKRVQESEDFAVQADEASPITDENVDGIEAEDAVLLEEDVYEAPEEAEIEIAEDIEDQYIEERETVLVKEEVPVEAETEVEAAPEADAEPVAEEAPLEAEPAESEAALEAEAPVEEALPEEEQEEIEESIQEEE
ncbi:MAG: hypothetical protein K5681_00270 [Treponema sp.]|nr:hypothetical protein [Treponema sp.]